ncbi:hypothetical protein HN924_02855 [Candidatus Woesearchaeota archaeon]|jgi:hypothetical protein|nr:hypothetical protein [Candidatus Woesearchaeota archaeon]MBT7062881.1 hypothetical protein [Candidatus Woesearchaeota archaeon]MBT7402713.1 hypothetical protein [Candidatus Woesearchaeota archaeon]
MKNKNKLLIGIIIVLIAIGGFYFREEITGFSRSNSDIFDEYNIDEIPDTDDRILEAPVRAVENPPGSKNWALTQVYTLEDNGECTRDCLDSCAGDNLEFYKAYVQRYGRCMCKCLPAN